MKTRGVSKALTLVSLLFLFASCQEEEFYEKDYIDTLKDQYERSQIPDDEAEQAWDDVNNNPDMPDYVPPVDDGSGDNGSGSGDDGSTTNPGDGSGSGDDGSTTNPGDGSGSGDDGSGDDGSTTNPGDGSGGDDGSGDDGSTTNPGDGSGGDDGSGDDGSTPGTTPGDGDEDPINVNDQIDSFTQRATGAKLDILWVIDNSGSMGDEQRALGENFQAFIKEFVDKDIDFKMAVTTTDTSRNNAGKEYKDSIARLTSAKLKENKAKFLNDFADMVKVGTRGSGYERGIKASEVFTDRHQNSWMRDDAYYAIVYMSDEEDQSEKSPEDHLKQISKWKGNTGLIKAYSIVDMVPSSGRRGAISRGYERYNEMSVMTGGSVASIKSDFHETLLKMGEEISSLTEQFPLSHVPIDSAAIAVYVDGVQTQDWVYNSNSNTIKFNTPPADGSSISIEYQY